MNAQTPRRPTILFTTEASRLRDVYFPPSIRERLDALGDVRYHEGSEPMTSELLAQQLPGVDVCLTHWNCPRFTPEVLESADRLQLIAHAGGSVADLVTREVFDSGITVTSANAAMAEHVAEGVLAYLLADVHRIPERAQLMRGGGWLEAPDRPTNSLAGMTLGLVGLGVVGRHLLRLVQPLNLHVLVHDPFVAADEIARLGALSVDLDSLLASADAVSLHASLTPETRGLIDESRLRLIGDGRLLINTARASLVDMVALRREVSRGRLRAVLDVFEIEPLPAGDPLRALPNATLFPHTAGSSSGSDLASLALNEIERFARGEPLAHAVSLDRFELMTREFDDV